jgi:hypothetical protein
MVTSLFTYASLGTLAGAAAATALVVAFSRRLPWLVRLSPQLLAPVAAFVILLLAQAGTGGLTWGGLPLVALNALLVAVTALGGSQAAGAVYAATRARPTAASVAGASPATTTPSRPRRRESPRVAPGPGTRRGR